jgi:copper(I)-binding protein
MFKTVIVAILIASLLPTVATSHEIAAGALTIIHPFVRATPPNARVGGGYLRIRNDGDVDDRLIAIEAPGAAKQVTMHRTVVSDGIASMVPMEGGLVVPAPRGGNPR